MGRKDFKKETMAKRARSRVMDDKMAKKMMMSPRKMMSMGKSPGPGMGADSAPMAMKKGGMAKKYADGGMVRSTGEDRTKRLSTTTGITAEQYQQAKAQNTDLGQMNREQRAQARQARMEYLKTRPNQLDRDPATMTNPMARKALQNSQMARAQSDKRKAARDAQAGPGRITQPGPMPAQKTAAFKKGGAVKKYAVGGMVAPPEPPRQTGLGDVGPQPGRQRQPGPMPMKQQNQPMRQKADQLRQMMDERKTARQQGQPVPRGGMSMAQQLNGKSVSPSGMLQSSPPSTPLTQQLMQQGKMQQAGTPPLGMTQGQMQQSQNARQMAGQGITLSPNNPKAPPQVNTTTRLPAYKKGGMVKRPASKNPMPMGPKGGKAGMMLIIGFGKKGKK